MTLYGAYFKEKTIPERKTPIVETVGEYYNDQYGEYFTVYLCKRDEHTCLYAQGKNFISVSYFKKLKRNNRLCYV